MSKSTSDHKLGLNSNMPKLSEGQLEPLFRRLNLAHTRRIYQDVADRAEKENWTLSRFSCSSAGRRSGPSQANPLATFYP